ncbi:MAG: hypothetical protein H6732_09940 [Alphaproteobacteria bacterium]|nr:hypothetical protein [Alphaproteobacteria bacterium]
MRPFSDDTDPAAHAVQLALLRGMTAGQRLALTGRIRAGAEAMAEARLRATYPDDDDRRIRLRLAALRYGDELMRRVFDWDPETEGR